MDLLLSPSLRALGVPHAFTTRAGGVSRGVFESLSFGNPMDLAAGERDPAENIAENFRRVVGAIGAEGRRLLQVYQVHGADVRSFPLGSPARDTTPDGMRDFKADALVTDDPAALVAVRVADCAPVLIACGEGKRVAAVHAGWRGVAAGVARRAVEVLAGMGGVGCVAAVGPCIGADAFEVGPEVAEAFRAAFGTEAFTRPGKGDRFHADLRAALEAQLLGAGVTRVEQVGGCTASEDRYFSHRRDGGKTGRMVGLIGPRG